jgi:hypothetical protein
VRHHLPPAPRAASDAQLAQAVQELRGTIIGAVAVGVIMLFVALVVVAPVVTNVLEKVAPGIYCKTIECTLNS